MKAQTNKKCTEKSFKIGDKVFLKLQPYKQLSMNARPNQKPVAKYFGSYIVFENARQVASKLDLSKQSQIHPIVHVSQLKKKVGNGIEDNHKSPSTGINRKSHWITLNPSGDIFRAQSLRTRTFLEERERHKPSKQQISSDGQQT